MSFFPSPSSRRAWIEIAILSGSAIACKYVALLAEGVDRNRRSNIFYIIVIDVALLAEGVDRNTFVMAIIQQESGSPSSRRAWIEISMHPLRSITTVQSPSSRRAWIEIHR